MALIDDELGIIDADDWTQMRYDFTAMRRDNEVSVVIRRETESVADHTLPPQVARVAGYSSRGRSGLQTGEFKGSIVVVGKPDMDIYPEDRFTLDSGTFKGLYRVETVYPLRKMGTIAQAVVVE